MSSVLAVGGAVATCAEAAASPLSYVGNGTGSAVATDGKRHAAYFVSEGSIRVLDEQGRILKDAIPPDLLPRFRTVAALGGGYVLLGDSVSSVPPPKLVQIATGSVLDVNAQPWWAKWDNVRLTGAGRHWISGAGVTSHGGADTYLNWRDGRVASNNPSYYEPRNTARAVPDLNAAELWRTMCSPLHRRTSTDPLPEPAPEGAGVWRRYQYRPPLGLTTTPTGRLLLERCGRRKVTTLSRCSKACGSAQLGSGIATWQERGRAYMYRARTRCKRSWAIPAPRSHLASVAHTSERVFVSTIDPESYGKLQPRPVWRIYAAPIPTC